MRQEESTSTLMDELKSADMKADFDSFITSHELNVGKKKFSDYLNMYLNFHPDMKVKDIIGDCGLDENYARQIMNGDKNGSKYKIIAICLASHMTLKETQRALTWSGNPVLYPKDHRDAAIIICINNQCYNIIAVNEYLNKKGQEILQ